MDRVEAVGRTAFRRDTAGMAVSHIAHVACSWTNNWLLNRQLNIGQSLSTDIAIHSCAYIHSTLCYIEWLTSLRLRDEAMPHPPTLWELNCGRFLPNFSQPQHALTTQIGSSSISQHLNWRSTAPRAIITFFVVHGIRLRPLGGGADHTHRVTRSSNSFFWQAKNRGLQTKNMQITFNKKEKN